MCICMLVLVTFSLILEKKKKPDQAFKQSGNPKKLSFGGMCYGAAVTVIDGSLSWLFRETCQEEEKEKDKKGKNMEDDNIPN